MLILSAWCRARSLQSGWRTGSADGEAADHLGADAGISSRDGAGVCQASRAGVHATE